jgi:23S rRNA pseudouridine1911/1915/1917 synthase
MDVRHCTAGPDDAGQRLDVWLHAQAPDLSRARIQALIADGCVTCAARKLTAHTRVTAGLACRLAIPPPQDAALQPEAIALDVLFEDADLIVVNKQAGLVVHPAAGHASGTLVNALLHHCADLRGIGGEKRPGIVHRLDKDTTGVIVAAKHEAALANLQAQFKGGTVRKEYAAIVHGPPDPPAGTIDTPIGRGRHDRKKMSTRTAAGRRAITHYALREPLGPAALVAVRIATGRTHQIRVHMAHIGHPVVGDARYGSPKRDRLAGIAAPRQMLHAARLGIRHPGTDRPLALEAPLPADMAALLQALRLATAKPGG